MRSIAVIKPDMAVLRRDRLGLSSFGMLSALFGEEILQRSRRRLGFWRPAPLELLEGPEQKAEAGRVGVHLDMTLLLKTLREEQRAAQSQEKRENTRTVEKLVERVILREQTQRVQERTQQINIQAGSMGHTICVTRQTPPKAGLEPVSGVTSAPPTGGWQPQWRQEYPGFSAAMGKPAQEGGGSILLPDALRRRRERILEEAALSAAVERTEELLRRDRLVLREQLKREVTRSVEETLARQRMQSAQRREPRTDADRETARLGADVETAEAAGRAEAQTRRRMETEPPCRQGGEKIEHVRRTEEHPGKPQTLCREDEGRQSDTSAEKKFVEGRERRETAARPQQNAAGETELIYHEGGEHIRETESASMQSHPIDHEGGEQTSETVIKERIHEDRPSAESAAEPQQAASSKLIYREGGEQIREAESSSKQSHLINVKREEGTSERAKEETGLEGKTSEESSFQPQQAISSELIYRESGDQISEVESASKQSHPGYHEGESRQIERVEKEQILEGRPSAESSAQLQQAISSELIHRESEDQVGEAESASKQSDPVYREGEARRSERGEKEQILEGRPSAESSARLQQDRSSELIYREGGEQIGEAESASKQSDPVYHEGEARQSERVEKQQILEGRPSAESSAQLQQDISSGLIYRESGDQIDEVESASEQSHAVYHEGEARQSESVEKEQILEGRPSAESSTQLQQDGSSELIYRESEDQIGEVESASEQSDPVYREGEVRRSERGEKQQILEGRPSAESSAQLQQDRSSELIYRESGEQIVEAEGASKQSYPIYHEGEARQSERVEREQILEGRPGTESSAQPQQDRSSELIYRESGEQIGKAESASKQSHPIYHEGEDRRRETAVKKEKVLEGRQSAGSDFQPQKAISTELIYREGGEYIRETESISGQSHPIKREGEEGTSETVEKEQILEGRPSVESSVQLQEDRSTELIYREGEDRIREGESVSVQSHSINRKGEKQTSETVEREQVLEGRPSAEPAAQLRQNPTAELIYRAGEDRQASAAGDEIHLGRAAKAPHTRPLSDQEAGLTYHKERPSQPQQPFIPTAAASGRERRLIPAHQSELTYRDSGAQQTAARDIRTLAPCTPEGRTIGLPASRREENPAELSYLQPPPSPPSAPPVERKEEPALPQWAQRLLEKPDTPGPRQNWRTDTAPGQQPPPSAGRQIQWTAPAAVPQAPNITYRAMQPAEPVPPVPPASISDRELRRATEKIYRMIEERLRREMRRSGR